MRVTPSDDLKPRDSFTLLSEEQAATVLLLIFAVCLLLDVLGVWA